MVVSRRAGGLDLNSQQKTQNLTSASHCVLVSQSLEIKSMFTSTTTLFANDAEQQMSIKDAFSWDWMGTARCTSGRRIIESQNS